MSMLLKTPILKKLVLEAKMAQFENRSFAVIFDIDSTLLSVSPRSQAILNFILSSSELQRRFPLVVENAKKILVEPHDWGLRSAFERYKIVGPNDFFEFVRQSWGQHFFSSDFLHHDVPYFGAKEFVLYLHSLGVNIYYLTGRDRPRMGQGTLSYLQKHGWPIASPAHLIMKPDSKRHDEEFKYQTISALPLDPKETWFFENEPVIIDVVRRHLPQLKIVFVSTVHSGRAVAPTDLPTFSAFDGYI